MQGGHCGAAQELVARPAANELDDVIHRSRHSAPLCDQLDSHILYDSQQKQSFGFRLGTAQPGGAEQQLLIHHQFRRGRIGP